MHKHNGLNRANHRGGTLMGIVIGLVIGLTAALAVAIYVTKAPINFSQKTQNRSAEQDAQEVKKNKAWDPNTPLHGKNPVKATPATESAITQTAPVTGTKSVAVQPAPTANKSTDPLGDLAKAKSRGATADPFAFFVQSGAFRTPADAETQRAKLAMLGFDAKVTEREQSGYTVYRVRVGPLDKKEEADKVKEKIEASGIETALVRVNR